MSARAAKAIFWFLSAGVAAFSLIVIALAAMGGLRQVAPHLAHYVSSHDLPLFAHMIFGPLALFLAPFQFWRRLRNRAPLVHRVLGYIYVAAVTIAGIGALLLLPRFAGSAGAATGFAILSVAWVGTTAWAVLQARAGHTEIHRIWMTRSAALTFAAVTLRLMMLPLIGAGMTITETYDITAWASWLLPLVVVELWRRRKARLPNATPA